MGNRLAHETLLQAEVAPNGAKLHLPEITGNATAPDTSRIKLRRRRRCISPGSQEPARRVSGLLVVTTSRLLPAGCHNHAAGAARRLPSKVSAGGRTGPRCGTRGGGHAPRAHEGSGLRRGEPNRAWRPGNRHIRDAYREDLAHNVAQPAR